MEPMNLLSNDTAIPALRRLLFDLAKAEENRAADEAATIPYWRPCPPSVLGHRLAAEALRTSAEALE
jgi:hypothetical protein